MKLIEKLSFDSADAYCKYMEGEYCKAGAYSDGYEAGFREAREMLRTALYEHTRPGAPAMTERDMWRLVDNLGEEEV